MGLIRILEFLIFSLLIISVQPKPQPRLEPKPSFNSPGQVVFLGDTLTAEWTSTGKPTWDEHYAPLGSVNTGRSSWTTFDLLRGITESGIVDQLNSFVVILNIGLVDLQTLTIPENETPANIRLILNFIQVKLPGAKIILTGILPSGSALLHGASRRVNQVLSGFADNQTIFFLDMDQQFSTGLGQVRTELYDQDGVKLSAQGYQTWQEIMDPLLNEVISLPSRSKVVWMGDSLSNRWMSVGAPIWDEFYAPIQTLNFGSSGHGSQDTLNLIERAGVLNGLNPKVAVLMIGANDLDRLQMPEVIIPRIQKIVDHFKSKFKHAKILLLGLIPAAFIPEEFIERGRTVNRAIEAMQDGDRVHYLNMERDFGDENGRIFPELYQLDGRHLTKAGYDVWHAKMWPVLETLMKFD